MSPPTTAVRVSVVLDTVDPRAIAGFWREALGYREAADLGAFLVLAPERGDEGPVVILQQVPEGRAGKNRMHLDLHPPDADEHVARLERLGARRLGGPVTELEPALGVRWQRMADPQGNEFCVVTDPPPAS
jgi:catechol 2,3-dioxygenase-like lactoylglutathione lyase family enzyme